MTEPAPEATPVVLPPGFDTWTLDARENWAFQLQDIPRHEHRERLGLYKAWLLLHPEQDPDRNRLETETHVDGGPSRGSWLTNAVTSDSWDNPLPPVPPTICRIEGTVGALFAAGRISRIFGASGSAKSFIVKLGALEVLQAGGSVLYLDADGIWEDFRDHLQGMALSRDDALSGRLHYSHVEGSVMGDDVQELLQSQPWGLIVIDGFNRTMGASGLKGNEDPDVNEFFARVLDPAAATGAAVVLVDHVKKDNITDHGSVFKRNNLTGTDYSIARKSNIAPGIRGYSEIGLTPKDRPGWATSTHAKRGRQDGDPFAYVIVDSTGESGTSIVVTIQLDLPADLFMATANAQATTDANTLRALLQANPAGFDSGDDVRKALSAMKKSMDASRINAAAIVLVTNGEATRTQNGRKLDLRPVVQGVQP